MEVGREAGDDRLAIATCPPIPAQQAGLNGVPLSHALVGCKVVQILLPVVKVGQVFRIGVDGVGRGAVFGVNVFEQGGGLFVEHGVGREDAFMQVWHQPVVFGRVVVVANHAVAGNVGSAVVPHIGRRITTYPFARLAHDFRRQAGHFVQPYGGRLVRVQLAEVEGRFDCNQLEADVGNSIVRQRKTGVNHNRLAAGNFRVLRREPLAQRFQRRPLQLAVG